MNCPKCSEEMARFDAEGVDLDFCDKCKGCWFDKGELAFYTETSDDVPSVEMAVANGSPTDHACPRCDDATLVTAEFMRGADLLVDICPDCHGVFLDKGELGKVETLSVSRDVLHKVGRAVSDLKAKGYQIM